MNEDELAAILETGRRPADDRSAGQAAMSLRRLLADEATWAEPDPPGADALLAAIRADQARRDRPGTGSITGCDREDEWPGGGAAGGVTGQAGAAGRDRPERTDEQDDPHRSAGASGRAGYRRRDDVGGQAVPGRRRLALVGAAVLLVVVGMLGGLALAPADDAGTPSPGPGTGEQRPPADLAFAGTGRMPEASARGWVRETGSGVEIWLDVEGLPPAAAGTYYQAWVSGDAGLVSAGTFHCRGDEPVVLWSGVGVDRYPTLTVTVQREGAGPQPSEQVVLTGALTD